MLKIQRGPDEINDEDHRKSVNSGKRVWALRKGLQRSVREAGARGESRGRGLAGMVFRVSSLPGLQEAG